MQDDLDPLPPDLWFERIEKIARDQFRTTENALRHAFHLLQLTPREFRPREYWLLDEEGYEALLHAGEFEAAARQLVGAPSLSITTVSAGDQVKAALRCSRLDKTTYGWGATAAAAILQAWAKCLLGLKAEFGADNFKNALSASSRSA